MTASDKPWDHPKIQKGMPLQFANMRARIAAGEKQLGWKVGLSAPAMMKTLRTTAPQVSYLMQSVLVPPGGTISFKGYAKPVAEAEIFVRMATDLGAGATAAQALAAIKEFGPAIEIVDALAVTADNLDTALANGLFQRHVVLGNTVNAGGDVTNITSRTAFSGKPADSTNDPQALTGKLVDVVAHVANTAAAYGERLSAGDIIITGSITVPYVIAAGETSFAHALDPIGEVSVNFTW